MGSEPKSSPSAVTAPFLPKAFRDSTCQPFALASLPSISRPHLVYLWYVRTQILPSRGAGLEYLDVHSTGTTLHLHYILHYEQDRLVVCAAGVHACHCHQRSLNKRAGLSYETHVFLITRPSFLCGLFFLVGPVFFKSPLSIRRGGCSHASW